MCGWVGVRGGDMECALSGLRGPGQAQQLAIEMDWQKVSVLVVTETSTREWRDGFG